MDFGQSSFLLLLPHVRKGEADVADLVGACGFPLLQDSMSMSQSSIQPSCTCDKKILKVLIEYFSQ
jgi:hypothetical protein